MTREFAIEKPCLTSKLAGQALVDKRVSDKGFVWQASLLDKFWLTREFAMWRPCLTSKLAGQALRRAALQASPQEISPEESSPEQKKP